MGPSPTDKLRALLLETAENLTDEDTAIILTANEARDELASCHLICSDPPRTILLGMLVCVIRDMIDRMPEEEQAENRHAAAAAILMTDIEMETVYKDCEEEEHAAN